ncbi:MAG: ThiF family adenylyltransferase, partial [Bacteroidales bacterium]|nr:ThiF family adenylyltransferase [Bacteroidales bacterium]
MWTERTEMLFGKECLGRLRTAKVLVAGAGGVGAAAAEMLVRAGIGNLAVVDNDSVS